MDALLSQLLPLGLGGSGVSFIAWLLLHERRQWRADRATLIGEHNAEVAEQEARHEAAVADLRRTVEYLRGELQRCRGGDD